MLTLGIESTCDETGFSIVADGKEILSNLVATQEAIHSCYGGVIPELASRQHVQALYPLLNQTLNEASVTLKEIDLIAVAKGPGLIGALLVGINFAKGLSFGSQIPLVGVNHIEAHLYAALMSQKKQVEFPALGVVLSGGHTSLVVIKEMGDYELIGQTVDDAVGEAFDKVATLLGLPYPGGPAIEKLASLGDPHRYPLKPGKVKDNPWNFSFSGLKTNVLYHAKGQNSDKHSPLIISEEDKKDLAASFQHTALKDISQKCSLAALSYQCKSMLIGGGVSNNRALRALLASQAPCPLYWPSQGLSLDNAAMIAGLGTISYQKAPRNELFTIEPLTRISF
jgi:N6-L-threonylcarbamoyladenine synthase